MTAPKPGPNHRFGLGEYGPTRGEIRVLNYAAFERGPAGLTLA